MAQKLESPKERPLQSYTLKNFLGVNTTNARIAIPDTSFYDLENAQPVGFANLHSIADISAALANFASDTPYYDLSCNVGGVDYLIVATTTGKIFSYNIGTQVLTRIDGGVAFSGSGTRMAQFSNTEILIIDTTAGYYGWNGAGNITNITGTGAPTSGTDIAVAFNRVWVAQNRVLVFSAPGTFSDFTVANGGGSTTLTDSTLRSNIQRLLSANGYLYVFGVSSVNAISDLYIPQGASPPTPVFTNLNLNAIVGTDQPNSVTLYGRLVLFANRFGIWSIYGTTVQSISSPDPNNQYQSSIDGTWQYASFVQPVSAGQVVSNNLLCAGFLFQRLNDPVFGSGTLIAMYQGDAAGGKWWFANYSGTGVITRVTTGFINNVPAMFAYIGNKLYQLFSNTGSSPPATVKTALWDFNDAITQKEVMRIGVAMVIFVGSGAGVTLAVDTEGGSSPVNFPIQGFVNWINNASAIVPWINNTLAVVQWIAAGLTLVYSGQAPRGFAKWVGITLTTAQGTVFEIDAFLMDYKFAARWVGN